MPEKKVFVVKNADGDVQGVFASRASIAKYYKEWAQDHEVSVRDLIDNMDLEVVQTTYYM
jgi:hypothetical protein